MWKGQAHHSKCECDKCHKIKRVTHMTNFRGQILCSNCKPHKVNINWDKTIKKMEGNKPKISEVDYLIKNADRLIMRRSK